MEEAMTLLAASLKDVSGGAIEAHLLRHPGQRAVSLGFELDSVEFLIIHSDGAAREITVYCLFGEIPSADESRIMRRMLEVNLGLVSHNRAGFGIDAHTGEAAYAFTAPLDTSNAAALVTTLREIARNAVEWRKTYFLEGGCAGGDVPSQVLAGLI